MKTQLHRSIKPVVVARPVLRASARPQRQLNAFVPRAYAPGAVQTTEGQTFMDELRAYSMKLHTKEQAPREGQAEAPKEQGPWVPTAQGYYNFLVESKVVYDAFEDIFKSAPLPFYKEFQNTGLERGAALAKDIAHMATTWGFPAANPTEDGPGHQYAKFLRTAAVESPPAFFCHYYNFYFAHTAGGRMIGAQVSKAALDGWMGDFYKWEGNVKELLNAVREKVNNVAEGWSREEKDACLEETMNTFKYSGSLLKLITGGVSAH